ncbi:MAG: hypothetical protein LBL64_04210 [Treponema sp.]|jgi:hypothetical protein|nr:hypothetical protein [Treponema sp.]
MDENNDYLKSLQDVLSARAEWLEKSELGKLKDELRTFQSSFSSLYAMYLKKGLIHEDPYKQENKISELEVPESSSFTENEKLDQLSLRLSNYDSQLDFLVNFYQFGVEFLNLDRIRRILGLIKYIDWVALSPDSISQTTKALAEMTLQVKIGVDPLALRVIGESLTNLSRTTGTIIGCLKILTNYNREAWKLCLRDAISGMPASNANVMAIKKRWAAGNAGSPFYPDLAEEVIKEDYSKEGPALREKILKSLAVAESKPKAEKKQVSFRSILIDGLQAIGGAYSGLGEAGMKMDENETILANRKKSFWEKVKDIMAQMIHKEPDAVIYELSYQDPARGNTVKENIDYHLFRTEMERKCRILANAGGVRGGGNSKIDSMTEEQLVGLLERMIREVQGLHKTLNALDDFFKAEVIKEDRDKIKGIKPELAVIKNAILRANQLRHEYSAQIEELEQMKKLGINTGA